MTSALRVASYPTIAIGADDTVLHRLKKAARRFVDGSRQGYKTLQQIYPDHIYDPLRRLIAVELAGKELAKIIDAEDNDRLRDIRHATQNLYDGRFGVYAPVHDFWSLAEMVLHVKKKELPELITAENVTWTLEHIPLEALHLTWMPFIERHPEIFGQKPWNMADLQRIFNENPKILAAARREQKIVVGEQQHQFDQSKEPVTFVERGAGLELVDGNGRLYKALLAGRDRVTCWVGRMHGKMPKNYWVSAGSLKQFCLEVRGYADTDLEGFASGVSYLRTKLRNNSIAQINYELFLRKDFPEFEGSLQGVLST
jgi:hypothetical protein